MDASVTPNPVIGDAFGRGLLDALHGRGSQLVIERADGLVAVERASHYLLGPDEWPEQDLMAVDRVSGRVLDIGAGAGRHSLALQIRGDQPLALDNSPGAIEACQQRGVRMTFLGTIESLAEEEPTPFDAALLMGNNLSLLGSKEDSKKFLEVLRRLLSPGGVAVGTCLDPYLTDDPDHLGYHRSNVEAGRMPGQLKLRVRYGVVATEWFDWLLLSPGELREVAQSSGWQVEETTKPDPVYLAVLRPAQ